MKKIIIFVCLMIHIVVVALAQPGSNIDDYRHVYLPDPATYLSGFLPSGAVKLTVPQAQQLVDEIDLFNKGKVSDIRIDEEPNAQMYRIGNNRLNIYIYNDSLRWAIEQAIMPTLPEDPGGDSMGVVDPTKYKPDIPVTNIKELQTFVYYTAGAHYPDIRSEYHCRLVSNSSMDLMLYYLSSLNFVQILGYDQLDRLMDHQKTVSSNFNFQNDKLNAATSKILLNFGQLPDNSFKSSVFDILEELNNKQIKRMNLGNIKWGLKALLACFNENVDKSSVPFQFTQAINDGADAIFNIEIVIENYALSIKNYHALLGAVALNVNNFQKQNIKPPKKNV